MKHSLNYALIFITFQLFILRSISAQDDGICRPTQCNGRNTTVFGYQKKCRCDVECEMYGDCCIDSPYKPQAYIRNFFDCVEVKFRPSAIYIKGNCNQFISLRQYSHRRYCLKSKNMNEQIANYTLKLPVTLSNGITYGNKYCTVCDNVDTNYTTWFAHFTCETHVTEINVTTLASNSTKFVFNNTINKWTYVDGNTTETCDFSPIPPPSLRARGALRRCSPNVVKSCPSSTNRYYQQCLDYMSIVRDTNGTYYKNEYCALCNNVSSSNLICRRKRNSTTSTSSTSAISTTAIPTTAISKTTLATRTSDASIRIFTLPTYRFRTNTPSIISPATSDSNNTNNSTTQVREFLHITVKHNCNDLLESLSLTKLVVETKSFATMKRSYIKESNLISSFPVRICKEFQTEEIIPQYEEPMALKLFVHISIIISILFISLHLYDFLFLNLSSTSIQKNFALYSFTLIIANIGFIIGEITDRYCRVIGSLHYFGFLTNLFWLSTLSFDIACKTWRCIQETDAFGKSDIDDSKKSKTYSYLIWISPIIIAFAMTYAAETSDEFLYTAIYESCWFPGKKEFVIFFIFPLTITISVNFAFWLFSAYVVCMERAVVGKLFAEYGIYLKFHTGLIITSNLMWSTALIALYNENSFIWLCFACLNATLGLLVYLCSPVKHAFAIKLKAYLDKRSSLIDEEETSKLN